MYQLQPSKFFVSEEDQCSLQQLRVPVPCNEGKRILYLRQTNLLDNVADEAYDRVTRLCARHFKTSIALVSLVDISRQWFKSRVGLDAEQTPRDDAFCSYTILEQSPRVMVVLDALKDERFKANPLVTGEPFIRFYAGASLIIDGVKVGTLCIIDNQPRQDFDFLEVETLIHFADLIADLMAQERQRQLQLASNFVDQHQHILSVVKRPLREAVDSFRVVKQSWEKTTTTSLNSVEDFFKNVEHFFKAEEILLSVMESSIQALHLDETSCGGRLLETCDVHRSDLGQVKQVGHSFHELETMFHQQMNRFSLSPNLFTCDAMEGMLLNADDMDEFHKRRWRNRTLKGHDASGAQLLATLSLCTSTLLGILTKRCRSVLEVNFTMESDCIFPVCFRGCFEEDDDDGRTGLVRALLVVSVCTEEFAKDGDTIAFSEKDFLTMNGLMQPLHGEFAILPSISSKYGCEYRFSVPVCSDADSERARTPLLPTFVADAFFAGDSNTENLAIVKNSDNLNDFAVVSFREKDHKSSAWKVQQKLFLWSICGHNIVYPTSGDSCEDAMGDEWSSPSTLSLVPSEVPANHMPSKSGYRDRCSSCMMPLFADSCELSLLPTAQSSASSTIRSQRSGKAKKTLKSSMASMLSLPFSWPSLCRSRLAAVRPHGLD